MADEAMYQAALEKEQKEFILITAQHLVRCSVTLADQMHQTAQMMAIDLHQGGNEAHANQMRRGVRMLCELGVIDQGERDSLLTRINDYETHHVPELDAVG